MKNIIKIALVSLLLYSCSDVDLHKPFGPEDTTSPSMVTDLTYIPLPGGAQINYTLPIDNDLSHIKAVYTVNGVEKNLISSQYNSSITILGFPDMQEREIELYSVDKSNNYSEVTTIKVIPEEAPIVTMRNSISHEMDFGGFKLNYSNPSNSELTMQIYSYNETFEVMRFQQSRLTTQSEGTWQVVDLPYEESDFRIIISDTYGNESEPYDFTDTPWQEIYCDKDLFDFVDAPYVYSPDDWYSWSGTPYAAWDDLVGEWNFAQTGPATDYPHYFHIDLGATYQIGRMLFQQRLGNSEIFSASCPKTFDLYGVAELPAVNNDDPLDGWIKLNNETFEIVRPSGGVPGDIVTEEDIVAASEGLLFTIDTDFPRPEIRYLKIVFLEGFQAQYAIIGELSFWAQYK